MLLSVVQVFYGVKLVVVSVVPQRQRCFPPCFRFLPYFQRNFRLRGKVSQFYNCTSSQTKNVCFYP